jgi:hypothetical protein
VGRVDEALGLLAAVRGGPVGTAQVAQLPHIPEELWAALARPVSRGGRTCVLCLTDLVAALEAGPVSGLLFDSWTEPIPGRTATTGVAVHFDSPGAQPPQAVLVATAEPGEAWTVDTLRTLVAQTLELAQIRAVGPETLVPWGHSLPAVFLPEGQTVKTLEQEGVPGPIDLPGPDLPGPIDLPGSIGLPGRRRSAGQKGRPRR